MGGITGGFSDDYALINSINAGCDIIIQNHNYKRVIDIIENAAKKGIIKQGRIDESALLMLKLKEKVGLHLSKESDFKTMQRFLGTAESHRKAEDIAQQSITIVKNDKDLIPLYYQKDRTVNVIDIYGSRFNHTQSVATKALIKNLINVNSYVIDETDDIDYLKTITNKIRDNSTVIINVFAKPSAWRGTVALNDNQTKFIKMASAKTLNIIMVSYGNPYIIRWFPEIPTYICAWDNQAGLQDAGARVVLGFNGASGKLPINIPSVASRGYGISLDKSPKYFQGSASVSGKTVKTVMPYEVGADIRNISKLLEQAVENSAFPGGVLLALKDGKIFIHEAFGYHTYAKSTPAEMGNIFDLASLTKVIATTSAIMNLYDDGKLKLDDPIGKYLPRFIDKNLSDVNDRKIVTIRHILMHTSGLPPFKLYYKIAGDYSSRIDSVYKTKLESKPGEKVVYSDVGFILLGKIVERISGVQLDKYVADNIFAPLGMNDTFFNPEAIKFKRILPTEYDKIDGKLIHGFVHDENSQGFGGIAGHAGLFSTADDLAIFSQMMLNGGKYKTENIFSTATVDLFTKQNNNDRYLGWEAPSGTASGGVYLSDSSFGHTGFTGTSLWIDPQNQIFVILLTNAVHPYREGKDPAYFDWRQRIHSAVYESLGLTVQNPKLEWRKNWNAD